MKKQSDGSTGEQAAVLWFKRNGWVMERHQPPTRVIWKDKKPIVIQCKSQGVADYTGYGLFAINDFGTVAIYRACEVKESHGGTMPCSTLDKDQRDWMDQRPFGTAFVGIMWMDGKCFFETFNYQRTGSYKKGSGNK